MARVQPLPPAIAERLRGRSWRPGCPVTQGELRHVTVEHWGYDGASHAGELVVHAALADEIAAIFDELCAARFPIERVQLVDDFDADDLRSMAANNTSCFNYRPVLDAPERLSRHSWGRAVDVNPRENPYLVHPRMHAADALAVGDPDLVVLPPSGRAFVDRTQRVPGLIVPGDACHRAFTSRGWTWGGDWRRQVDWQHFEKRAGG